MHGETLKNTSI